MLPNVPLYPTFATLKSPRTKISIYDKSLVKFGRRYLQGDNQSENTKKLKAKVWSILGHLALPTNTQKSLYQNIHLWQILCQIWEAVLLRGQSKWKHWLKPIESKSLEHFLTLGIAHQHSKVPVPKYPPMTNPLSGLGGRTFNGTIKEKTLTETHSEQKFEASLANWHCPPTLKSPCTKILPYDKSLGKVLW